MKKIEPELIPNPDMNILFYSVKITWEGVSFVSNRYSKVSNKSLKSYSPKKESKHIIYLDSDNLYGFATSKFLSRSRFKCKNPKVFDLNKYISNSSKECLLRVSLEYPKELCELHNSYPLAPDKIKIKEKCLIIN